MDRRAGYAVFLLFLLLVAGCQQPAAPPAAPPAGNATQSPPQPPQPLAEPPKPSCAPFDFSISLELPNVTGAKEYQLQGNVTFRNGTCEVKAPGYRVEASDNDQLFGVTNASSMAASVFGFKWKATPGAHTLKAMVISNEEDANLGNNIALRSVTVAATTRMGFEDTSGDLEEPYVSERNKRGQQFAVDSSSVLRKAYLYIRKSPNAISGGSASVVLDLREDKGDVPKQSGLATARASVDSLSSNMSWVEFTFDNVVLAPGKYWLMGYTDRGGFFYWHKVRGTDKSPYGTEFDSVDNSATKIGDATDIWSYKQKTDFNFAVELDPAG